MKPTHKLAAVAVAGVAAAALTRGLAVPNGASASTLQHTGQTQVDGSRLAAGEGAAFAMTNATKDNRIVQYRRLASGALERVGSVSTRGEGIGVDLDTQGPLHLSADHRFLYAVNAGSDDVSVFSVTGTKLTFVQKVYAGDEPVALTIHKDTLYVLDGSVASNSIRGFHRGLDGTLTPITNSIQPLSSPIAVPGDIEFSPGGSLLLVTEKTTALTLKPKVALDAFAVDAHGVAGPARRDKSNGIRPFALAFRNDHQVLVGESFDAAQGQAKVSSYTVSGRRLKVKSRSVPDHQTDTCWIVITHDGRYAFTANFGANTISSYAIRHDGSISLHRGNAAFLGPQSEPVDLAQTADSKYLYLLLRGTGAVAQFAIDAGGNLTPLGVAAGGLPVADGASGLAVY